VIESSLIATSSGLAVTSITIPETLQSGSTIPAIATQPNTVLQFVYVIMGIIVALLLSISVVLEARRFRMVQVAYGVLLLCGMGVLWYTHILLTGGAVIV